MGIPHQKNIRRNSEIRTARCDTMWRYKMSKSKKCVIIIACTALSLCLTTSIWAATLVWDPNTDQVDGYKVHYGTNQSSLSQIVDVGNVTQYNLDQLPLQEQVEYFFSLSAYNAAGDSGTTTPLGYTPADTTPPAPPTGLEAYIP
jgi:hypothetical protein